MTLSQLQTRLHEADDLAASTIKSLQSLIPLPSGCENCWGDLHKGCTAACRTSNQKWHDKRQKVKELVTALITALQENEDDA